MRRSGSVPMTPAMHGHVAHDRQHLALAHLLHDGIGVAVGQHAGEAAVAGHADSGRSCR